MTVIETVQPAPTHTAVRMVTAVVRGVEIRVPCPEWCTLSDHETDGLVDLVDLFHAGETVSLLLPVQGGEVAMSVRLTSYPFDPEASEREPHLLLTAPSGDCVSLPAALAESVAVGLERQAATMRALTGVIR